MKQYLDYLRHVYENGTPSGDRTGTGVRKVFGYQMRFDLSEGLPLVTTKKLHFKSIVIELLWFLRGSSNIKFLTDNGVKIWNEWADETGDLGPLYPVQWRSWPNPDGSTTDQIAQVVSSIKNNPESRRHIVCSWNVSDIPKMALSPCHPFFQFFVADGKLSCMMTQRSVDSFLGACYNIASYALLTHMIAQQCDLEVGEFIWSGGDCHIYDNHIEQVELQLTREPYQLPTLTFARKPDSIDDYNFEDFILNNYVAHPHIKAPVAV